jgi:hypothetical protein
VITKYQFDYFRLVRLLLRLARGIPPKPPFSVRYASPRSASRQVLLYRANLKSMLAAPFGRMHELEEQVLEFRDGFNEPFVLAFIEEAKRVQRGWMGSTRPRIEQPQAQSICRWISGSFLPLP